MGEVYRARDTRLGRDVAIKVLPESYARDEGRLRRFEQEARAVAALNHQNILTLFDLGTRDDGSPYLVEELLEGETLREALEYEPLRTRRAVEIARDIASALAAAHEKGVIHRDLKPENVFLTRAGQAKVLDFGLAKLAPTVGQESQGTTATDDGLLVGTAGYMSPEQVRSRGVDARSDIFAFGSVFYEMLSGRRAFKGDTTVETLTAILREEPPELPNRDGGILTALERLVRHCLEKSPERRFQSAHDLAFDLEGLLGSSPTPTVTDPRLTARGPVWMLGCAMLAAAIVACWSLWLWSRQMPSNSIQLQRLTDFVGMEESPAISPDGKTVAFVASVGGRRHIWIRLLTGGAPLQITRDDTDHEAPRWAPDSNSLIYYSPSATAGEQGSAWEIPALGGPPRRVAAALGGADISHDSRRLALFRLREGRTELAAVSREGSDIQVVTRLPPWELYEYPRWSPDDRWIAFERTVVDSFDIAASVVAAAGGEPRQIARGAYLKGLSWRPDGSGIVYASSFGSSVSYPPIFNLRTVGRDGAGERQVTFGDLSYVQPDLHRSGKLLASRIRNRSDIWRFPVTGSPAENKAAGTRVTHQTGQAQTPSVSPDDKEVVYLSDSGGHGNLWVAKTDGSGTRQLTFERDPSVTVGVPVWSPAGDQNRLHHDPAGTVQPVADPA